MGRKIEREIFFSTLISTAMYAVGGGVEGFGPLVEHKCTTVD